MGLAVKKDVLLAYEPAGEVAKAFHRSSAFVRGVMGPVGSGKSSACWMELFTRAQEQKPNAHGVRRSRALVVRNTYPELKSTTIKTVQEWCPLMKLKWDFPITGEVRFRLQDGTRVEFDVYFLALELPQDVDKIGSLEVTFAWVNENREVAKPVFDKVTERVGRFPPKKEGGATWRGVVTDTNPPDSDHWYYKLAEKADPELLMQTEMAERQLRLMGKLGEGEGLYEFFRQPGGLLRVGDEYLINPKAENIQNLDGGHAYYFRQLGGKREEWVKAQILGEYAVGVDGKPVYSEFSDELHSKKVLPLPRIPIIVGLDYGRTPAAAFVQLSPRGQLRVLDELCSEDMGIGTFAEDVLKPHIALHYRDSEIIFVGDPAGMAKESDEKTAFDVLADHGIVAAPAHTNRLTGRLEAVRHYLSRMVDGQPAFAIDPKCTVLRKGFIGKYHFKRVQTTGERVKETPEKNDVSHVHDALQYACLWSRMENMGGNFSKKIAYPNLGVV